MIERLRDIHKRLLEGSESDGDKTYVTSAYQKIIGKPFSGCKCEIFDACVFLIKKLNDMSEYRIRRGVVLRHNAFVLTHNNCTDEQAKSYLERNPQDRHFFEKLPPVRKPSPVVETKPEPTIEEKEEVKEEVVEEQPKFVRKPKNKRKY